MTMMIIMKNPSSHSHSILEDYGTNWMIKKKSKNNDDHEVVETSCNFIHVNFPA